MNTLNQRLTLVAVLAFTQITFASQQDPNDGDPGEPQDETLILSCQTPEQSSPSATLEVFSLTEPDAYKLSVKIDDPQNPVEEDVEGTGEEQGDTTTVTFDGGQLVATDGEPPTAILEWADLEPIHMTCEAPADDGQEDQ